MAAFSIRKSYLTDWTGCKHRNIKAGLPGAHARPGKLH